MKEGNIMCRIGDVFETCAGGTPLKSQKDYYEGGNIPWLRSGEVCKKYITETERFITQKGMENSSAKMYPMNTVVVAMYGATAAQVGILKIETTSNQAVCGILPNPNFIPEYVYYWFVNIKKELASQAQGGAQPNISQIKIKNILIPRLNLDEQRRIVSYLDSSFKLIDEIKNKALKSLTEAKALFQSALAEAMEPKEGWEEKTLGDVGSFKRGGNFTKRDFIEDGFPCVHYGQIHMKFGHVTKQHLSCVPKGLVKKDRCAKKGDLIIAITSEDDEGSCKCTAWMANYEVYVGGHTAIYTHNLDPIFMAYYFQSPFFQKEKLEYTHGFKVVEINPKDIAKISIAYPPLPTQKQIVSRLDKLSSKVRAIEEKYQKMVDECDALKQAMLRDVFE